VPIPPTKRRLIVRPRPVLVLSALVVLSSAAVALAATPKTRMASVTPTGDPGNGESDAAPSISSNGRFVAFASEASDLVPGDTLGNRDVFVRDMVAGTTTRVSVRSNGAEANGSSESPAISGDGRYVAFASGASNLVNGDTNENSDVFVHDRQTGMTRRVSVSTDETQALGGGSEDPSISSAGGSVVFTSGATNLVGDDTNGNLDVFVRDLMAGTTTRVSVRSNEAEVTDGVSTNPWISPEGTWVAFQSLGTFTTPDTGPDHDVFLRNLGTGKTSRVSILPGGVEPDDQSFGPSLSANAAIVAFVSEASDLGPTDENGFRDVYAWTRATKGFELVSVDLSGDAGDQGAPGSFGPPTISPDGRFVAFDSGSSDLVADDGNGKRDAFVRDRTLDQTIRVSLTSKGAERDGTNSLPFISADGRFVAFESDAKLVAGDDLGLYDIFRRGPLF